MLISHEIPTQLFSVHDLICDYSYVLAHLLVKDSPHYDSTYTEFYSKKIKDTQLSVLDNGAYELGKSIDIELLYELGELYRPSHIVLPDVYGNYEETREWVEAYLSLFGDISTPKFFAALQGNTIDEYLKCYDFYNSHPAIDIIGINFRIIEDTSRLKFLESLFAMRYVEKKVHLLGCSNPGEFLDYGEWVKKRIYSVDTSSPIIHGWLGNRFDERGYEGEKPKIKLAENLGIELDPSQLQNIYHNVQSFRSYVR